MVKGDRIYQTDAYGNTQYRKPGYVVKGDKVYQTDEYGNTQYHKPGFEVKGEPPPAPPKKCSRFQAPAAAIADVGCPGGVDDAGTCALGKGPKWGISRVTVHRNNNDTGTDRDDGGVGRKAVDRAATLLSALGLVAVLVGCEPINDPSAGMSTPEAVALIDQAPHSDIKLPDLAEAFALGTKSTEVQREHSSANSSGTRVEWDIPVYEVSSSERSIRSDLAGDSDRATGRGRAAAAGDGVGAAAERRRPDTADEREDG